MKLYSKRAGELYHVQSGYDCFVPTKLINVSINEDDELKDLLSRATYALGKLDGIVSQVPNKDLYLATYVQKEATVSSQIEGTQASLSDVLQAQINNGDKRKDTQDIVNYVKALNNGLLLMDKLPLSIRFLKEVHKDLLVGVRGEYKNPGELRNSQNWIGPAGCGLNRASFVPPCVEKMNESLYDLENYLNSDLNINALIKIALVHYQFETIHPFLDGNGRLGRLLIALLLKNEGYLKYPLLYLSLYFKQNRTEYYGHLMDVRFKGKYEEWIKFFLKGIIETANDSMETIEKLSSIKIEATNKIDSLEIMNKQMNLRALDYLFVHPYVSSVELREELNVSKPTISKLLSTLVENGILKPTSSKQRNVTYRFTKYADVLEEGTESI